MKIRSLELERFRRFSQYKVDFADSDMGRPLDLIMVVGNNGSGKSSILQAVAATLGTATRQIDEPKDLSWPGFTYESISAAYRGFSKVTLDVEFSQDELDATSEYFSESDYSTLPNAVPPGGNRFVQLTMKNDPDTKYRVWAGHPPGSFSQFFQFRGRIYAYNLVHKRRYIPDMFRRIGSVFWYHEQRTSYSLAPFTEDAFINQLSETGYSGVRRLITNWFAADNRPKVEQFNSVYTRLFPGKMLNRIGDTYSGEEPSVLFHDNANHTEYELAELSGGERALLPILLDFTHWDIHNSVILIDELELHLHPPLQQRLLTILSDLGKNNQFIITTHSDAVAALVPEANVRRVEEQFA